MELTPDERRLIEETRAQSAISQRPVDRARAICSLLIAMRQLAVIGKELDPNDGLWSELLKTLPEVSL
jgi:hypothetical protein